MHLIALDMKNITKIRAMDLHSKCSWTPFERWDGIFPIATFVRGELVAKDRELQEEHKGRLINQNEKP